MRPLALERDVPARLALLDYFFLMKPGIVALVLVSTMTGVYFGQRGLPDLTLLFWALAGMALVTAGSAVLNNYFDRDIDCLMERTASRALATGTIEPANALIFGITLLLSSMACFFLFVNSLTALLSLSAAFGYVVLYGVIMKRRSSYANLIGGIAGSMPPVIGYAAVTGTVGIEAVVLFVIMTIWQQPHALSLAMKYRDDYAKASIPVVPVARGINATKGRILNYTIALVPMVTLPYFVGMAGIIYLFTAVLISVVYLVLAARFKMSNKKHDMFLFFFSIIQLTVLFTALVFDIN